MIFIFISLLGLEVSSLLRDLASIKKKAIEMLDSIQDYIFRNLNISIEDQFQLLKNEKPFYDNALHILFGSVSALATTFILVLAYFVFLLLYRIHIKKFLLKITPKTQRPEMKVVISSAAQVSQQYLLGLSKMIVLLWIMYTIGFSIISLENALLFAILCGLFEIVPYIGNITGTVLTILVAAVNGANSELIVGIIIVYGVVQLIQTWIFEPLVLGPQVKINPLFTIIFLVIGELLWGIPGLILAIPLAAIIKIICDHIESLKPYGVLIGKMDNRKAKIDVIEIMKTQFFRPSKK
jgi:predicted PurR-regulated permease PerM